MTLVIVIPICILSRLYSQIFKRESAHFWHVQYSFKDKENGRSPGGTDHNIRLYILDVFLAEEWDQFPPLHWLLVAVRFIHEDILRKSNDLDLDYLYM